MFSCFLLLQFVVAKYDYSPELQHNIVSKVTKVENQKNTLNLVTIEEFSISLTGFESFGTNATPQQLTFYKNHLSGLFLIGCNELILASEFSQYNLKATNQLVRFRKKDLIFPFHYFT